MTAATARRTLGVLPGVSAIELKRAYRQAAQRSHPDKGGSEEAFVAVAKAYEVLSLQSSKRGTGKARRSYRRKKPGPEDELGIGSWFHILALTIDGTEVPNDVWGKAQLVTVGREILIAIYLDKPWTEGCGSVSVLLSDDGSPPELTSIEGRNISQRSFDKDGALVAFWFAPLEERMFVAEEEPAPPPPRNSTPYNTYDARSRAAGWSGGRGRGYGWGW